MWWQRQRQDFMHYWGWIFFSGQYFQEWIFFRSEYFQEWIFFSFQEWIFFKGDYFSGVNIYPGWIFSGVDIFPGWIFSGVDIFQGWLFFRDDYFSLVNIFHGRLVFKEEYFSRVIFLRGEHFSDILYSVNIWLSYNLLCLVSSIFWNDNEWCHWKQQMLTLGIVVCFSWYSGAGLYQCAQRLPSADAPHTLHSGVPL